MSNQLMISIPCTFKNKVLVINALSLKGIGDSPKEALLDCIKNTALFNALKAADFAQWSDFRDREFMHIEIPYDSIIMKKISEVEPLPEDKIAAKKKNSKLTEANPEEILHYGF